MQTRRYFLKTVILGAAAVGARGRSAECAPSGLGKGKAQMDGEGFGVCHSVRDGAVLPSTPVGASHDVVIVGGGPSGLVSAYRLRDRDLLLLEKEDRFGGNCVLDEWRGVRMSTGGAFYTASEGDLVTLFDEIGAKGMKVEGGDSLVIHGQPTRDFFRAGADQLPLPKAVRDDFKRSREDLLKRLEKSKPEELDAIPFSELLKPYAVEVRRFWDAFGPSNWGGDAANTSGLVGCASYKWAGGADDPRSTFPGGMAGAAHHLAEWLAPRLGERMKTGATTYRIERDGAGAVVRYLEKGGEPRAVRARTVIVAAPKFYASRVVAGLPAAQVEAMQAIRYAPYPVFNVCLESPGPEPAYDNFFIDTPFTDFIPADWILYGGKGPKERPTALTVYHPLPEGRRAELLDEEAVLGMADAVAEHLERHFPGTIPKIAEVRAFRRGHPMYISAPGAAARQEQARSSLGPIHFANTDSDVGVSSFAGALDAAQRAVAEARKTLSAPSSS
jgi:oxygen-dependent protoporphyrinogen oxidase